MTRFLTTLTLVLFSLLAFGQIKGSGKIITKNYAFTDFDKIHFEDLTGKIEVEIGKDFSVQISIDDNLEKLLSFSQNKAEYLLTIRFEDNQNNRKYIERSHLSIKITMPEASVIRTNGNSNLSIKNVAGRYIKLENSGNGNTEITGAVETFDIEKMGNGDIVAGKLKVKTAKVTSMGNGDVLVNVSHQLNATMKGNGDIKNVGSATFDKCSTKSGNGQLIKL